MNQWIRELAGARLIVAGESGIDEYIWGDSCRLSPEAPVPVVEVESQSAKLGLSANVAQNIIALGGKALLVTVTGNDEDGEKLEGMVQGAGIESVSLRDDSRPTLRKVRVIAQKQHIVRVDYEKSHPLSPELARRFSESIRERLGEADGVIVQDYGKGLWNSDTMGFVAEARRQGKPVFVDPSRNAPLGRYRGVTLLTPNLVEAEALCGSTEFVRVSGGDDRRLRGMAERILDATQADHAIITCGPFGMISLSRDGVWQRIPTFAREVFDVTGAGDTVVAVLSMLYVTGQSLGACMTLANAAAGIVVGRMGASSVTPQELQSELEQLGQLGIIKGH